MGTYYPVAAVCLYVQLDEFAFGLPDEVRATLEAQPTPAGFRVLPDGRWLPIPSGPDQVASGAARRTLFLWAVPQSLRIERNPYREADTCHVRIRHRDLPIHPLACRSIGIAAYLGTVSAESWDEAIRVGVTPTRLERRRASREVRDFIGPADLRFVGFADEVTIEHGDGGDWVTLSCRDFTQGLLDTPVPSALYREMDWSKPVDWLVREILDSWPGTAGVPLHLMDVAPNTVRHARARQHRAGAAQRRPLRARKVRDESYWDLLTDLTAEAGLLLYADVWAGPTGEGTPTGRFVLTRPADVYAERERRHVVDYPSGDEWDEPVPRPVLVYGANISTLTISRRMGKVTVPAVELRCLNGKETLVARYPPSPWAARVSATGMWARDEARVYTVTGFTNQQDLAEAARLAFEELGRGELTLRVETSELASFGGGNNDPDLLGLRAGVPLEVHVAPAQADAVATRLAWETMDESAIRDALVAAGQEERSAAMLAAYLGRPEMRRLLAARWYVRGATHEFGPDGYELSVEAVNYVQARVEKGVTNA